MSCPAKIAVAFGQAFDGFAASHLTRSAALNWNYSY
jgi:hypothetical protein